MEPSAQTDILRVRLFAAARQLAGCEMLEIEGPWPMSAQQVVERLAERCPQLEQLLRHSRLAVNQAYAAPETCVHATDEVAWIPPVSGG